VGAHAVRNRSKCGGVVWAGAGAAWRLGVCVVFEAFLDVWRRQLSLCGILPQGVVCKTPTRYLFDIIPYKQNIKFAAEVIQDVAKRLATANIPTDTSRSDVLYVC
jgi:hypothetical protein